MKRLAEELSVAEAWEIELEARRWRVEESLKPPLLGLFDKLEEEEFVGDQLLHEENRLGRVEKLAKVVVQELARPDIIWSCLDK